MSTLKKIINSLSKVAKQVRSLEAEATIALFERNNKSQHHELMVEKALLLLHMPETISELKVPLDQQIAKVLKNQLGAFSFSAGKALDLNSVFYMSALLYPEDYTDGMNNDLENFIEFLEGNC